MRAPRAPAAEAPVARGAERLCVRADGLRALVAGGGEVGARGARGGVAAREAKRKGRGRGEEEGRGAVCGGRGARGGARGRGGGGGRTGRAGGARALRRGGGQGGVRGGAFAGDRERRGRGRVDDVELRAPREDAAHLERLLVVDVVAHHPGGVGVVVVRGGAGAVGARGLVFLRCGSGRRRGRRGRRRRGGRQAALGRRRGHLDELDDADGGGCEEVGGELVVEVRVQAEAGRRGRGVEERGVHHLGRSLVVGRYRCRSVGRSRQRQPGPKSQNQKHPQPSPARPFI
ncbi:hypothetical protein B0H17DRAFT_1062197 [Mycena rosella]|uniref:Uncharacterized protein n=1 Tax=Mycena rosella TaxID=1033263 RepID=A0AAD7DHJ2_MYCRO|nr:hypothetical protein B0H17DRAFT_1062197 [Mycena rosella]